MLLFTIKYYIKNNIALANLLIIAQIRQMKFDLVSMTLNGHSISSMAFLSRLCEEYPYYFIFIFCVISLTTKLIRWERKG